MTSNQRLLLVSVVIFAVLSGVSLLVVGQITSRWWIVAGGSAHLVMAVLSILVILLNREGFHRNDVATGIIYGGVITYCITALTSVLLYVCVRFFFSQTTTLIVTTCVYFVLVGAIWVMAGEYLQEKAKRSSADVVRLVGNDKKN